jgi:CRP-like cAMP-binding protein
VRVDPALLDHPYFAHFSSALFGQLAECASRVRLPAGATLFAEGEESADCYVVERGAVTVQRSTPYGPYRLATLRRGDIFGETGFIDGRARSGDVLMVEPSELLLLSPAAVRSRIDSDKAFAAALYWAFWKSLSAKLRATNERLLEFFGTSSRAALAAPLRSPDVATAVTAGGLDEKRKLFSEQKLSQMEINFLASVSKQLQFRAGQTIFREGEAGEHLYVVLEGKVRISKNVPGAGEEALSFLERGDYFGEMALIDDRPRSADARAHSGGAEVLAIPKQVVDSLLHQRGVSSVRLLTILCLLISKRLRETDDKIVGWYVLSGGPSTSGR